MCLSKYSLTHLPDEVLLRDLPQLVGRDRAALAEILAHIAEFDARRLYVPAAYPSMVTYCMGELRLSEDAALKRIRVARMSRDLPEVLEAIEAGRLSLSAALLLKPFLTRESFGELVAAAEGKSRRAIEQIVARLGQPELEAQRTQVAPVPAASTEQSPPVVPEPVTKVVPEPPMATLLNETPILGPSVPPPIHLRVTLDQETQRLLRHAQDLLSHRIPSGNPAEVFRRALEALVRELRRRKYAVTERPREPRKRAASRTRHIPAHVKRAVLERDGFQCTFVSASGRRCESRTRLEFDHVIEFARGGEATIEGLRLRCRTHNQYTAEQTFGADFMRRKRANYAASFSDSTSLDTAPLASPKSIIVRGS
jgi:5-methylcytosine-specific restriction endonuclease McrA